MFAERIFIASVTYLTRFVLRWNEKRLTPLTVSKQVLIASATNVLGVACFVADVSGKMFQRSAKQQTLSTVGERILMVSIVGDNPTGIVIKCVLWQRIRCGGQQLTASNVCECISMALVTNTMGVACFAADVCFNGVEYD